MNAYLRNIVCAVLILCMSVCLTAHAQTTAPQQVALNAHSSVDDILQALYQRGQNLQDFTADISKTDSDNVTAKDITYIGALKYQRQAEGDVRIRVSFSHKKLGDNAMMAYRREGVLQKGKYIEQDYDTNKQTERLLAKPGEKINPVRLGEGPFPLPIGQDPQEVKKQFSVKLLPPDKDDPPHTIHTQLVPKEGTRLARRFSTIDVWVDTQTHFTPRIQTVDVHGNQGSQTDLTNLKINSGLNDKDFQLPPPGAKWSVSTENLEE